MSRSEPRKILVVNSCYVPKYDAAKKSSVAERISIGKLVDPNDRTRMYANLAYTQYFPDVQPIEESAPSAHGLKVKRGSKAVNVKAVEQDTTGKQV